MKPNPKPFSIALVVSIFIGIIATAVYVLLSLVFENYISLPLILLLFPLVAGINLFVLWFALELFIYDKIKLIYKNIHSLKAPKGNKFERIGLTEDVISKVNQDVISWAADKKEEIEQLKKMEEYRRSFLGNVAHELKTPIFNIQGYISTLLDGGLEDKNVNRNYLERTSTNIDRMVAIIDSLDTISRLESGEIILDVLRFDILQLTQEVIELLENKSKIKNIKISINNEYESPYYILGDRESIRQVLTNLLDNSIKYGKEGGKTKISFYDMDKNYLIEISDDGIGMNKQYLPRLFERFFRVDKSRSREQGGSGLGLAIVKHIVEAHNQTIHVRSTLGLGSTFSFTMQKG